MGTSSTVLNIARDTPEYVGKYPVRPEWNDFQLFYYSLKPVRVYLPPLRSNYSNHDFMFKICSIQEINFGNWMPHYGFPSQVSFWSFICSNITFQSTFFIYGILNLDKVLYELLDQIGEKVVSYWGAQNVIQARQQSELIAKKAVLLNHPGIFSSDILDRSQIIRFSLYQRLCSGHIKLLI